MKMKMKHLKVGRVAFWKYDLFPYILGGTIDEIHPDGDAVQTVEFGKGTYFRPSFCLPKKDGLDLLKSLDRTREEHRAAIRAVNEGFIALIQNKLDHYQIQHKL